MAILITPSHTTINSQFPSSKLPISSSIHNATFLPSFLMADDNRHRDSPTSSSNNNQRHPAATAEALNEDEIATLRTYGVSLYSERLKKIEHEVTQLNGSIKKLSGIKESDTGLGPPSTWNLAADIAMEEMGIAPLTVGKCTSIMEPDEYGNRRYMVQLKRHVKFVVGLGPAVAPIDIEEGMRVGCTPGTYEITLPLPPRVESVLQQMIVEEKPDVTYADVGGCKEQIKRLREVVELPLLEPERFVDIGIEPPKGVLFYGPPGTGKTLCARAVANRTDACFIRIIGSELVGKYVGQGALLVRRIFQLAKSKKACILFFDEIDAFGGARFDSEDGNDNEVNRTMLELVNQLDGFDSRGAIKVIMATNRPDTLDPALVRPGRVDRRIEFGLPNAEGRESILRIHVKKMSVDRQIRYDLIARMCPSATGADLRSVCTEAGMFALRARRKRITEKDFLAAVHKVIKGYAKFSSTPSYMTHN